MFRLHHFLNAAIIATWLTNGLVCKLLNLVPRHTLIVAGILGPAHARTFTIIIGLAEVLMCLWILSGFKSRLNAVAQMVIIGTMNLMEFLLVPHLLLWGRWNAFFAALLIFLIYYNEFALRKKSANQS